MSSVRAVFVLAAMVLSPAMPGIAVATDTTALATRLVETLHTFRSRYGFPGATAAIALPDGSLVTAATGLADVEAGRPMTPGARMLAASIGKTFVGATVLALESEGLLSRADLLAEHLHDRPWFTDLPNADTMTLGHLLRHQSGLPDHAHLPEFETAVKARIAAGGPAFAPEELLSFIATKEALFQAGSGWGYSDTGYILLGLVIEKVTGRPYYISVTERFLAPLGLLETTPSDRPELPGLAVGYTISGNPFGLPPRTADAEGRLLWDPAVEWSGGGLVSTSRDLARWGHALFGGEAMRGRYLDRLLDAVPMAPDTPDVQYGAGVAIHADTPRGPVYGHGGWIPAFVSSLRHYADYRVTVALQINSDAEVADDSSDLIPALESALADLAIGAEHRM
ncbi:serine hydrolase domain-containing protein [Chromatocurvus halotolerans]|uniref:D-alanyl-D-alanine carboxypeptidase n=1 Tax=Chromatocurvus halotolerans TaxID=1132028 RepID=A0A4V2SC20_9GAMM|nr:serine hydrolase domain-containing protein [Chromatocurvus halotolerans]TCO77700.1 D-alanyl-D-alanine carboxypeptidase [Chromatocurvus halotolerans]